MTERDMYYGGFIPMNPNQNNYPITSNNYTQGQFNDLNERINRLERQVKRLEQRLTRLETPYANNINNEPDNNMYIM